MCFYLWLMRCLGWVELKCAPLLVAMINVFYFLKDIAGFLLGRGVDNVY